MRGGGQRPFGTFPKIHQFWRRHPSLTRSSPSHLNLSRETWAWFGVRWLVGILLRFWVYLDSTSLCIGILSCPLTTIMSVELPYDHRNCESFGLAINSKTVSADICSCTYCRPSSPPQGIFLRLVSLGRLVHSRSQTHLKHKCIYCISLNTIFDHVVDDRVENMALMMLLIVKMKMQCGRRRTWLMWCNWETAGEYAGAPSWVSLDIFFRSFFRFLAGQTRVCHRWLTDWPTFDFVIYDKPLVVRELSRRHTCQRSHVTFETFDQTKTKTMRPWQRRVTSETFVQSFEETWPDQKKTKTQTKTNSWQSLWPDN